MKVLSTRSQQEFEIPSEHQSPTDWSTAIFELAGVERNPTPSMRIHALARTARAIYTEYKTQIAPRKQFENRFSNPLHSVDTPNTLPSLMSLSSSHDSSSPLSQHTTTPHNNSSSGTSESVLGADDFLPIFIFIFCRSELVHPIQNKDLLWKLCHPDQLQGESGYYLTIYESAVEYVLAYEIDDDLLSQVEVRSGRSPPAVTSSSLGSLSKFFNFKPQR
jgi:hypothetical protein